jgi:hypothetical protein
MDTNPVPSFNLSKNTPSKSAASNTEKISKESSISELALSFPQERNSVVPFRKGKSPISQGLKMRVKRKEGDKHCVDCRG